MRGARRPAAAGVLPRGGRRGGAARFTLDDVARGITEKMRRRNPHVFAAEGAPARPAGTRPRSTTPGRRSRRRRSRDVRHRRACPTRCPRCCTPTRCSTAWRAGPGRAGRPDAPGSVAAGRALGPMLGERLLALVAEARAAGRRPRAGAARRRPPLRWTTSPPRTETAGQRRPAGAGLGLGDAAARLVRPPIPTHQEQPVASIEAVGAREILDSRGNPTVEVEVAPRRRHLRPRRGAQRRLHRRLRGGRAARRRRPLPRQGRRARPSTR